MRLNLTQNVILFTSFLPLRIFSMESYGFWYSYSYGNKGIAHYNFWVTNDLVDLNGRNKWNLKFFVTEPSLVIRSIFSQTWPRGKGERGGGGGEPREAPGPRSPPPVPVSFPGAKFFFLHKMGKCKIFICE